MARAMGGDAGHAPALEGGSTFWFTLMLKLQEPSAAPCEPARPETTDLPVLVIDDNQANRVIMAAILEHFGHRSIDTQSAEEALELLQRTPVKAIMLDHTLPGMSGLEFLRGLRAAGGAAATLPVIPVTGRVAPEDKAAFAKAGANGFVEKPVTARAIRDALSQALAAATSGRAAA
jgi:CheY-like chemotaxis protein